MIASTGHPKPLRTLIDTAVTERSQLYGGGGQTGVHVLLPVRELLEYSKAEVCTCSLSVRVFRLASGKAPGMCAPA